MVTTTFSPATIAPQFVESGKTLSPFTTLTVNTDSPISTAGLVQTGLAFKFKSDPAFTDLGKITDSTGAGVQLTPTVFREVNIISAVTPTAVFQRLVYAAPTLQAGESIQVDTGPLAATSLTPGGAITSITPVTPALIDVVTAPSIKGATANQPVAATNVIRPFATVTLKDTDFATSTGAVDSAAITITDGGKATDADGLLTGPGVSKTGVGNYTIGDSSPANLQNFLRNATFTTTDVTTTAGFELDVTDTKAKLTSKDTTSSVQIIGGPGKPPSIAGTEAGLTVASGNTIHPFSTVTVSDAAGSKDSATITLTGGDANGTLSGVGLTKTAPGVYSIPPSDIATLNAAIDGITFTPTAGAPFDTTGFTLTVANDASKLSATDTKTTVIEGSGPPTPPDPTKGDNFLIVNQTTGAQTTDPGVPHTGPVPGIDRDLILITKDNLNISAQIPNVFIHSGSGRDALQALGGTNILDGSTGTNFLTGGSGLDTFFIDDRAPPEDIFSTIANFHAGDSVSAFGVTKGGNTITPGDDVLPAAPGLNFAITAPGAKNANFNIPGYHVADLTNGKLTQTFGKTSDGTDYMMIHANG